jgi:CRP-like cAMP-binding protein/zinc transporter ZupT
MPDAILAGGLAGLAALSLPLGAVINVLFRPAARVVAIVMAFGSGALIHAVVTELAVDPANVLVGVHHFAPFQGWLILAGGFLAGGLLYVGINEVVSKMGGGFHWRHRLRKKALEQKRADATPILEALSRSPIARRLSPADAESVLPFIHALDVPAGTAVYRPGEASDAMYIVASGTFELRARAASADESSGEHATPVEPGAAVGGLNMLGEQPRTATFMACTAGSLLTISRTDFERLMVTVPGVRDLAVNVLAQELVGAANGRDGHSAEAWQQTAVNSIEHVSRAEVEAACARHGEESSPLAIFIGALQDGIPESIAIGASFVSLAAFSPTFMVAVFLSNLPEAVAGTAALLRAKFSLAKVMLMWAGLVVGSAIAGGLGYVLLHDASPVWASFLGALAGGGVVAMLAMTMMPEAYESGRSGVAPATIVGFLASLLVAVMEIEAR